MSEIVRFSPEDVLPDRGPVLESLGIPAQITLPQHIAELHAAGLDLFERTAAPVGLLAEISNEEFASVYQGEGQNEPLTPIGEIYEQADYLALFTVTLGEETSSEIRRRFESRDFALGSMLDAVASEAADRAADLMERRFGTVLQSRGWATPPGGVLRYSPGYCGWHVTGQRRLFSYLHPEQIGVTLTESCLMQPLKSVSGVVIAAARDVHDFKPSYPFCRECETKGCRVRIRTLLAG